VSSLRFRQTSPHVTAVSQNRVNYAEKKVMGVKTKDLSFNSNARENGVFRWWS
jgi:hypothetical protein